MFSDGLSKVVEDLEERTDARQQKTWSREEKAAPLLPVVVPEPKEPRRYGAYTPLGLKIHSAS